MILLHSVHEIIRLICQVLWLINCQTFLVLLSHVLIPLLDASTWASISVLLGGQVGLSCALGSGLSKSPLSIAHSLFFGCFLVLLLRCG